MTADWKLHRQAAAAVRSAMVEALHAYNGDASPELRSLVAANLVLQFNRKPLPPGYTPPCAGANCGCTDCYSHSIDCLAEACRIQGWR